MKNNYKANFVVYFILIVFAGIFILPFLYALYTSLLELKDVDKIVGIENWTFDNYIKLWSDPVYNVARWFLNSVIMTSIIIIGNIIINSMAAYSLAKLKFPGKKLIFLIIIATMAIPYQMILIPVYVNMKNLGWLDTMKALTVPYLYQCIFIFLMRQFFLSVPNELLEAARIDGLSKIGIFFKIMLPLSKPGIATMIILNFTSTWNSYLIPSTMISQTNSDMFVLVVGLNSVKDQFFERTNLVMAGVILITIPVIILFLIFQKQFVEGIVTSGIKG